MKAQGDFYKSQKISYNLIGLKIDCKSKEGKKRKRQSLTAELDGVVRANESVCKAFIWGVLFVWDIAPPPPPQKKKKKMSLYLIYVFMYVCIYVCMYLCMYVCMYLSIYLSIYLFIYLSIYLSIYLYNCEQNNLTWKRF